MRFHIRHAAILVAALVAACQSVPPHAVLPDAARDQIASTEVVLPIPQQEIYVFVPAETGGAGFGLLGVLVDATVDHIRSSKAEVAVKPLRAAMVDYDFDGTLKHDVQDAMTADAWLGTDAPRVMKEVTDDKTDAALAASKAAAVLFVAADYQLSNDGYELKVSMLAALYPNTPTLRAMVAKPYAKKPSALANAIYRNTLIFKTHLAGQSSDRDGNIGTWSAGNGSALRAALNMASLKLAALLAHDLQQTPAQDAQAGSHIPKEGRMVGSDADGSTLRNPDGTLIYTTAAQPLAG